MARRRSSRRGYYPRKKSMWMWLLGIGAAAYFLVPGVRGMVDGLFKKKTA